MQCLEELRQRRNTSQHPTNLSRERELSVPPEHPIPTPLTEPQQKGNTPGTPAVLFRSQDREEWWPTSHRQEGSLGPKQKKGKPLGLLPLLTTEARGKKMENCLSPKKSRGNIPLTVATVCMGPTQEESCLDIQQHRGIVHRLLQHPAEGQAQKNIHVLGNLKRCVWTKIIITSGKLVKVTWIQGSELL